MGKNLDDLLLVESDERGDHDAYMKVENEKGVLFEEEGLICALGSMSLFDCTTDERIHGSVYRYVSETVEVLYIGLAILDKGGVRVQSSERLVRSGIFYFSGDSEKIKDLREKLTRIYEGAGYTFSMRFADNPIAEKVEEVDDKEPGATIFLGMESRPHTLDEGIDGIPAECIQNSPDRYDYGLALYIGKERIDLRNVPFLETEECRKTAEEYAGIMRERGLQEYRLFNGTNLLEGEGRFRPTPFTFLDTMAEWDVTAFKERLDEILNG